MQIKRFHNKLDISSQAELFSLFLEALSMVPLGADLDPLHYYYSSQEIVIKTRPGGNHSWSMPDTP